MKYTTLLCLLAALIISLSLTGCSRDPKPTEQDSEPEVSLELGEDNSEKEENTKPSLAQLGGEDNEKESSEEDKEEEIKSETQLSSSQEEEKPTEEATEKTPEPEQETPVSQTQTLPFSQQLQTRPQEELKENPQKLDTRLYAVFKNTMEQNFSRKKGTLSVYRLNYDGTEGAYELQFDLNAAYDEKGNLNKNAAVDANMKVAETLQAGINYGQGSRETYKTYQEYADTLEWLKSPLLSDEGFMLKNFSKLTITQEDGHYLIETVYTPAALKSLYDQEIDGTVSSYIQLDQDGNIEQLGWEQIEVIDDYPKTIACSEYTFK